MRHRVFGRKFGRTKDQRKALLRGLAKALIKEEKIVTTLPKAKDLRPFVEKLITKGKVNSIANKRYLFAILREDSLVSKVVDVLSPRYANRNGGYTRIVKCGFRSGDAAPMAGIMFIKDDEVVSAAPAETKKTESKKEEAKAK